MKSKIEQFNQTNKDNIEVEMTVMGDNYPQAVDIAFASKQALMCFKSMISKRTIKRDIWLQSTGI